MKVLDLHCSQQHVFEGWFGSEDDYVQQQARGLVSCPMCGDTAVQKKLSAPRLNLGAGREPPPQVEKPAGERQERQDRHEPHEVTAVSGGNEQAALQAAWLALARRVVASTEDVGPRFAEEARRIHYGESEQRGIRGQATREETAALQEEGINVVQMAWPEVLKTPLQ